MENAQQERSALGLEPLAELDDMMDLPVECETCGNQYKLRLLLQRSLGDLKVKVVAAPDQCQPAAAIGVSHSGRVKNGRFISPVLEESSLA